MRGSTKVLLLSLFFAFAATHGVIAAAQQKKVVIAQFSNFILYLPLYVAHENGYFKDEGLDVDIQTSGTSGTLITSAVLSETIDFGISDIAFPALARKKGGKLKVVAPLINQPLITLMVAKDHADSGSRGLKGLSIALQTPPNTVYALVSMYLRRNGFTEVTKGSWKSSDSNNPKDYVTLVPTAFGTELAQVSAKRAQAAAFLTPFDAIAEKELQMRPMVSLAKEVGPFMWNAIFTTEVVVQRDPAMVQGFVNALVRAFKWTHQNPDAATAIATKRFPSFPPSAVSSSVRKMLSDGSLPRDGALTKEAFNGNLVDFRGQAKDIDVSGVTFEEFVDTRFVERANRMIRPK